MRKSLITVVEISSPSYSGTTWLCLLFASHERALTVGPPDRVWQLRGKGFEGACRVHGEGCAFWKGFAERYDPGKNFYVQLAEYSGKDIIVINNPSREHAAAELRHPDIRTRAIQVVRDGRALACSFARHLKIDVHDAITGHVSRLYREFVYEQDRDDVLALRYEDVVREQEKALERVGNFVGITYPQNAREFWKFEHHITAGNAGAIGLLKFFSGLPVGSFKDRAFYEGQFERMRAGESAFDDQRWRVELGRRELYQFDRFCGRENARWGYEPDAFTWEEREAFEAELSGKAPSGPGEVREALVEVVRRLGRRRRRILIGAGAAWAFSVVLTAVVVWLIARGG